MKIKTSELTDLALDWAVSVAEQNVGWAPEGQDRDYYSSKWEHGGPIIEREGGTLWSTNSSGWRYKWPYNHANDMEGPSMSGPTPLIAAMRCYVAAALGDEVDVPEELV